jgi:hypothetical protein
MSKIGIPFGASTTPTLQAPAEYLKLKKRLAEMVEYAKPNKAKPASGCCGGLLTSSPIRVI